MTKISDLSALTGASVDTATDLLPIVDMSAAGATRNKKITVAELLIALGIPELARDTLGTALVAGTNITITVNDGADTITIDAAGGGGGIDVEDEGVSEATGATTLNFTGAGVVATDAGGGVVDVTIAGGGGGVDVEDEGVSEATGATILNFTGAGVTATDAGGGQVDIDIPGGGGSFVGCRVKRTSDQTTANYTTQTAIPWQAEVVDDDGAWAIGTPERITVPSAWNGKYANAQAHVELANLTNDLWARIIIRQRNSSDATIYAAGNSIEIGNSNPFISAELIGVPLATGDYFEAMLVVETDTSITVTVLSGLAVQVIG